MPTPSPAVRRLVLTWALLSALTLLALATGAREEVPGASESGLGLGMVAVILAATWIKAQGILREYLALRTSTAGWRGAFAALLLVILGLVLAGHAIVLALLPP